MKARIPVGPATAIATGNVRDQDRFRICFETPTPPEGCSVFVEFQRGELLGAAVVWDEGGVNGGWSFCEECVVMPGQTCLNFRDIPGEGPGGPDLVNPRWVFIRFRYTMYCDGMAVLGPIIVWTGNNPLVPLVPF